MPEPGTISVVGQGRAQGTPDVCRVDLTVGLTRPSVAAALADGEAAVRGVRSALTAGGVDVRDTATGSVTVRRELDYGSAKNEPRLVGYAAEHSLQVVLRDLAAAGRLLGEAVVAGGDAVQLQGVQFAVEDDAALRSEARAAAWADAVRTATQLAELAGRSLGAVLGIDTAGRPRHLEAVLFSGGGNGSRTSAEVGLVAGSVAVDVTLAVVWELG